VWQKIILWIRDNFFNVIIIGVLITTIVCGYLFVIRPIQSISEDYKQLLDNQRDIKQISESIAGTLVDVSENYKRIGETVTNINRSVGNIKQFGNTGTAGSAEAQRLIEQQRKQLEEAKGILESITNGSIKK
jgi:methyl-accepting chemotaxis protein